MCNPTDSSPPGSPVPGILQARTLEWVAISFSNTWKWSRSVVSDSLQLHGLQPTRLLRPWDFPGKSTGVGCHCLLRMLRLHICVNIYSIFWIHYHIQKYGSGFVFVWKFFIFKKVIYSLFLAFLRVPWTAWRQNQSILKEIHPEYSWKDWCWSWSSNTLATWYEELTHWKRPWRWERLKAGEGDDRGWDGWMASPTWWTWVWASSGSWWWTGKPGALQSMGLQRVNSDWATELNWHTTLY